METMVAPSGDQEGFKDQVTVNKFGNWKAVECQKITEHDMEMYNDIYTYIDCVCVCFEYCSFSPGNRQSTSKSFHSNHGLSSHNHRTPKHSVSGAFNSSHKSNISIKYDRSSGAEPELKWLVHVAG